MSNFVTRRRRVVAVFASLGAAVLVAGLAAPAAAAAPAVRNEWVLGVGASSADGVTFIDSSAYLQFTFLYLGVPGTVTCTVTAGAFSYTAPTPAPGAAPGTSFNISITPPAVLGGTTHTYGACTENLTAGGGPVAITTTSGWPWTLSLTVPNGSPPGTASPYTGSLTGTLTIPTGTSANGTVMMTLSDLVGAGGVPPCVLTLPTTQPVSASMAYSGTTGIAANTSTPTFGIDKTGCPVASTTGALVTAALTLVKASTTTHPDLVWQ